MKLIEYIVDHLKKKNVSHFFGIPGDFILPAFVYLDTIGAPVVVATHEPALGYMADAYARLNGLSAAFVTYGPGALNMVNSVAMAYAESSPMLVISGAPELSLQQYDRLIHHRVKTFDTQFNVYSEITCTARKITSLMNVARVVDEVIATIEQTHKPGYLEIPRDLIMGDIEFSNGSCNKHKPPDNGLTARKAEIYNDLRLRVESAKNPIVIAGAEIIQKKLKPDLERVINLHRWKCLNAFDGKSAIREKHPLYAGTYMGSLNPAAQSLVRSADLIMILGAIQTDLNVGFLYDQNDKSLIIQAVDNTLFVSHHHYDQVSLKEVLEILSHINAQAPLNFNENLNLVSPAFTKTGTITIDRLTEMINWLTVAGKFRYIIDVCELYFNVSFLRVDALSISGYYASMGFSIPAAIASCLLEPELRTIVFVGDGSFQMTGSELGVAVKHNLNPIIVVLNNGVYKTLVNLDRFRPYYKIPEWDYVKIAEAMGAVAMRVSSIEDLARSIDLAQSHHQPVLIDAIMDPKQDNQMVRAIKKLIAA